MPDRHDVDLHLSEDLTDGSDITAGWLQVADGTGGMVWDDGSSIPGITVPSANDTYLDHGNTGSTETFDQSAAHHHRAVLNTATVTFTFSGAVAGESCSMVLELVQDGTGSRTVTWPGSVTWVDGSAPTLHTAAGSIDWYTFVSHDGGTIWYGFEGSSLSDHDHSASGAQGGSTLSPGTLNLPTATSPAQTADGRVIWDSDDDVITVGDGSSRKTFGYLGSTVPGNTPGSPSAGTGNEVARATHDHGISAGTSAAPLMTYDGTYWLVVVDGDGSAVMVEG